MFDKLLQAQQKAEEIRRKLDDVLVEESAEGGKIRISATASKEIKSISIDPALFGGDKEELEELLVVALNKTLQKAEQIAQAETQAATKEMLGGLGGMFGQ